MADPIIRFWMSNIKNAWYDLSDEEQKAHLAQVEEALAQVGGKSIVSAWTSWSQDQWVTCGVEEYPDLEAVQEHTSLLHKAGHFRYFGNRSILGSRIPSE